MPDLIIINESTLRVAIQLSVSLEIYRGLDMQMVELQGGSADRLGYWLEFVTYKWNLLRRMQGIDDANSRTVFMERYGRHPALDYDHLRSD